MSTSLNSVESTLMEMLADIRNHQRDKNCLLSIYVEERLNKTVNVYYKDMVAAAQTLSYYKPEKVLNRISKHIK